MNTLYIGTMTNAYLARDLLRGAGSAAYVSRMAGAAEGCGYRVVTDMGLQRAMELLQSRGIALRREPR